MYNEWFSNEVVTQLNRGVDSTEVKITSKLPDLKPLHASWTVDLYKHLKKETGMIIKGFDSTGITEEKCENSSSYLFLCLNPTLMAVRKFFLESLLNNIFFW